MAQALRLRHPQRQFMPAVALACGKPGPTAPLAPGAVPEPGTCALLFLGRLAIGCTQRHRTAQG